MLFVRIVVGGTPSSGKSKVVLALAQSDGFGRLGVAKLDCVSLVDEKMFLDQGLVVKLLLAGRYCPDHLLMESLPEIDEWACDLDTLVIETAGLCGRCAPYLCNSVAICVIDCTAGSRTPYKLGPLLTDADIVVLSKGDLVSQPEREIFAGAVRGKNPGATLVWFNGLTGEGAWDLVKSVQGVIAGMVDGEQALKTPLPQLYCSYCLGKAEVGIY